MGEKDLKQTLTLYDKFTVFLYRSGIIISMVCIVYAVNLMRLNIHDQKLPWFYLEAYPPYMFWIFVISVNISVSFLHLYSKKILKIIRAFSYTGTLILAILSITQNLDFSAMYLSNGLYGKIGIFGLGLILAGFSGIGAKEAFCFRLYEGYAYAILLFILVVLQILGVFDSNGLFYVSVIPCFLIIIFTIRKMFLPLHYDIGDKSRYSL